MLCCLGCALHVCVQEKIVFLVLPRIKHDVKTHSNNKTTNKTTNTLNRTFAAHEYVDANYLHKTLYVNLVDNTERTYDRRKTNSNAHFENSYEREC